MINNSMNEMRKLINLIESAQVQEEPMGKLGKAAATAGLAGALATASPDVKAQPEISDQPGKIATPLTVDQQDTTKLKNNVIKFTKKFMKSLEPQMPQGLVPGDWKGVDLDSIKIRFSSLDRYKGGQRGRANLEEFPYHYIHVDVEYFEIFALTRPARKSGSVIIKMTDTKDPFKITSIEFNTYSDIFPKLPGIKDFVYDKPGQPGIGLNLMTGKKSR